MKTETTRPSSPSSANRSDAVEQPGLEQGDPWRDRLFDIDRAKGFAIALVVWGHLASATIGQSPLWFYVSVAVIYSFHMPLFMYLSGFVFFYVGGPDRFWTSPRTQISARADRLLVPFVFFGVLVVFGKYFANSIAGVADPVNSISDGIAKVAMNAPDNPSASIWYLFVLFVYTIITPIIWKIANRRIFVLLTIGVIGWLFQITEYFYIKRLSIYFIFFTIGGLSAIYKNITFDIFHRYSVVFFFIFLIAIMTFYDSEYALLICGIASIPAIHGILLSNIWRSDRIFLTLGKYSMAIYLLNTIFLGVSKIISAPIFLTLHPPFFAVILIFFIAGLMGPIALRLVAGRFAFLRPVTRYLD